jgi:hypothetical protein
MSSDPSKRGRIARCPHAGCAYRCCDFQQGNYIAAYPGELEQARARGFSTEHLKVLDNDDHGGHRVKCVARDTATCDAGYKPLDCASYPFFPTAIDDEGRVAGCIKGEKCPLALDDVRNHVGWAVEEWGRLVRSEPAVGRWVGSVKMLGYVSVPTVDVALVLGYGGYGATALLIQAARARGLFPVLVGDVGVDPRREILKAGFSIASDDALQDPRALAERLRLDDLPRLFRGHHVNVAVVLNCQDWMWPLYLELTRAFPGSASVAPTLVETTALKPNLRHRLRNTDFHVPYAVVPIDGAESTLSMLDLGSNELILKPLAGGGSDGVERVDPSDPNSVRYGIERIRKANERYGTAGRVRAHLTDVGAAEISLADYLLAESLVKGDEYSIEGHADSEGYIDTLVISRKSDSKERPFRDLEYVHNPRDPRRGKIEAAARKLLEIVGFRGQAFHLEMKVSADGESCKPIELNPRQGGGSIREFVRGITGVDLLQKSLHDLLSHVGQPPVTVLRVVQPEELLPGRYILKGCEGIDAVARDHSCVYAHRYEPDGAEIRVGTREYYLLELGATAPTEAEAIDRARRLAGQVNPNLEPSD